MKIWLASALLLLQTAAVAAPKKTKMVPNHANVQLGTSFRFDGSSLNGRAHSPFGTTAVVENDKYLEDLLGARKNFDDREKKERSY